MPKKKLKTKRTLSTYELIDWYFPAYVEIKPGSTDQSGVQLEIRGLIDGRYIWNVIYTRERFPNGRQADWQLGVGAMLKLDLPRDPVPFGEALRLARELMAAVDLPIWRDPQ